MYALLTHMDRSLLFQIAEKTLILPWRLPGLA